MPGWVGSFHDHFEGRHKSSLTLTSLALSGCVEPMPGPTGSSPFGFALQAVDALQELDIGDFGARPWLRKSILTALQRAAPTLRCLRAQCMPAAILKIGLSSLFETGTCLEGGARQLQDVEIDAGGPCDCLVPIFGAAPLMRLRLAGDLGDGPGAKLVQALRGKPLAELSLPSCKLGSNTARYLAVVQKMQPWPLEVLNLSGNGLGAEAAELIKAFAAGKLRSFRLQRCALEENAMAPLGIMVVRAAILEYIDVRLNPRIRGAEARRQFLRAAELALGDPANDRSSQWPLEALIPGRLDLRVSPGEVDNNDASQPLPREPTSTIWTRSAAAMASLLDSLAQWVEATSALQELEAYVRRHAAVFAEREEYDHACFEIYRGYEALVERLLTDFLEEVRRDAHLSPLGGQWTPERLLSVLREERAVCRRDVAGQRFQVLIAITTFEVLPGLENLNCKMSITVDVGLLSGKTATVKAGLDEEVGALQRRAQIALGVGRGRLVDSSGSVLDASAPIKHAKLENGDVLMLQIHRNQVQACHQAFAAILGDGSVVTWGRPDCGGDSSSVQDQLKNVQQIQATARAFAAILGDGSVVTWGGVDCGGDSSSVQDQLKNVQQIQATARAFAAILGDGSVVSWGGVDCGGDSSSVQDQLKNVQQIQATARAFAAILGDGSIVSWGGVDFGGDSSAVQDQLKNVQQIQATARVRPRLRAPPPPGGGGGSLASDRHCIPSGWRCCQSLSRRTPRDPGARYPCRVFAAAAVSEVCSRHLQPADSDPKRSPTPWNTVDERAERAARNLASSSASSTDRYVGEGLSEGAKSANDEEAEEEPLPDQELWESVVEKDWQLLGHAPAALRRDRRFLSSLLSRHGLALMHAAPQLRNDRDLVLVALRSHGGALAFASHEIRNVMYTVWSFCTSDYCYYVAPHLVLPVRSGQGTDVSMAVSAHLHFADYERQFQRYKAGIISENYIVAMWVIENDEYEVSHTDVAQTARTPAVL
ncbi:hypothetical protein AK812_SmicGene27585 [Symbiodinium microadriaticum]|uniref:Uncharacterized protein n=1 Tax=Symbiodinium microadriaticum TaxID=2951 RepID=A0A1Q9D6J2_SYMMI|nr:hypothetical protein AK812_SmicGene27585 [Symbiodinium microadriaticum]